MLPHATFPHVLRAPFLALLFAVALISGCTKTHDIGTAFAVDVPAGWYHETDDEDPNLVAVGTKRAEWTWVFVAAPLDELGEDETLEDVSKAFADDKAHEDPEHDDVEVSFGDPQPFSVNGLEGVTLDGETKDPELTIQMKLVVLASSEGLLMGMGFRSPDAGAKHDAANEALLRSLSAQ